jgi:hypothetical protein
VGKFSSGAGLVFGPIALRPRRLNHHPGLHLLSFGVDRPTCESAGIRVLLMYEFGIAVGDKTIRP